MQKGGWRHDGAMENGEKDDEEFRKGRKYDGGDRTVQSPIQMHVGYCLYTLSLS